MHVRELQLRGFRNLQALRWQPGRCLNFISGANGAGKTSLVEAVHLLSHGRSFRCAQADPMIQSGESSFEVFADCAGVEGARVTLGMARGDWGWQLRRDRVEVPTLAEFVGSAAVVTVEPESSILVNGPGELRRRFLDWSLFHVEPEFLGTWRRYMRALRQRNSALRLGAGAQAIAAWEPALVDAGERMDATRRALLERLRPLIIEVLSELASSLVVVDIGYRSGWAGGGGLAQALQEGRESDRERRFTQRGPHRADWRLVLADQTSPEHWSRGQCKLLATACLLAQARLHWLRTGAWPVLIVDDLASELDMEHRMRVLSWLRASSAQVLITGTGFDSNWRTSAEESDRWFHVEQGQLSPLL